MGKRQSARGKLPMMNILAATAVCAILGLRFKVCALLPPIALGVVGTVTTGIGRADWSSLLVTALAIAGLQLGYVAGAVLHYALSGVRARRQSAAVAAITQRLE